MPRIPPSRLLLHAASLAVFSGLASHGLAQDLAPADAARPFDLDWSVGLRGGYVSDSQIGGRPEIVLAPEVTLSRAGPLDSSSLVTGGAVALEGDGSLRLDDFHARAKSTWRLDPVTTLEGQLGLGVTRASPGDLTLASDVSVAPQLATGTAELRAARRFGQFELELRGTGARFVEGESVLVGGGSLDNTSQNYWLGQAGLRLGYEATPLLTLFVDGSDGYQKFDIAAPGLGHFLDGRSSVLRAGITWGRDELISAEISAGRAFFDFTDAALTDRSAWILGGSARLKPDPTLTLSASLDSGLSPSATIAGDVDLDTALIASARYQANPWLVLRATAGWNRADTLGSGDVATSYGGGVGVDYQSTRHLTWSADYGFVHSDPVGGPGTDSHQLTVGATLRR